MIKSHIVTSAVPWSDQVQHDASLGFSLGVHWPTFLYIPGFSKHNLIGISSHPPPPVLSFQFGIRGFLMNEIESFSEISRTLILKKFNYSEWAFVITIPILEDKISRVLSLISRSEVCTLIPGILRYSWSVVLGLRGQLISVRRQRFLALGNLAHKMRTLFCCWFPHSV
ncbi:unnamed protein product [Lepeophtheirus salmonis]|uniref:(salmon louse) hypothetical protein n=1 Tax=Lepeophtheirus salmonis TaxID=72036 RepID=A0A817FDK3_LEPSM|nr:unnamed protein product [Lepeophtheirus salmonis]